MKNIFKKIFFSVLVTCLFISCSDFSNSDSSFVTNEKGRIIISTNLDSQSRSVLPTGITEQTQGLTWELVGTCEEKTYSKEWDDTISEDGSVTSSAYNNMISDNGLLLDVGTWSFSLKVKNNNGYVLVGKQEATITSGGNILSFVMNEATSDDLSDRETVASGSIEFTLKFPKDVIDNVVVSLSKINTSSSVVEQNLIPSAIADSDYESLTFYAGSDTNTSLKAGSYILKMELQQQTGYTDSGDGNHTPLYATINTYTCLVRVAPGLCSKGEYTLETLDKLYTIKYECGKGTFDDTVTITTSYNAYTTFILPTPTLNGHTFEGWYTDENYTIPINNDGTFKLTSDTTVYAKWIKNVEGITHANNTLYISSYEGLKVFRDIVNGSLESNITIPANAANSGASVNCNAGTPVTTYNAELQSNITITEDWTPIGVYTNASSQVPYVGEFKGNNNTITFDENVSINSQAAGLFGAISNGCNIYNLIIDGNIQSSSDSSLYAGGIVGVANGGSVQNCVNKAKIQNASSAGGIAGKAQNTSFNGCVNLGEITGTSYIAGIVGAAAASTSINLCINVGKLTSSITARGISGEAPTDIIVQNCINLGTLSAGNFIYGISSGSGTISSNISAGKFEGTVMYNFYAVCSSASNTNYYDNSICSKSNFDIGSAEGKTTSDFSNWSPDELYWSAAEGRYPLPNISENVDAGIQAIPDEIWNEIYNAAAISVNSSGGGSSIAYAGIDSVTNLPIFYIYSAEGLEIFRNIVNGTLLDETVTSYTIPADSSVTGIADYSITTSDAFANISGVLQADIDLSGIEWIPIGTEDSPFEGSFDGQNKTISNLTISNATTENQGLFGVFDCSLSDEKRCLSNICVTGSITTSSPYAGGLVGQATNIVFQNCENYIEINSSSETVGGFVGQADTCDFIGCTNYAGIISTSSSSYNLCVGGIAGLITDVTAKYCYNAGDISANMSVGGIFGFEQSSFISYPTIEYCVNTGVITGSSYYGGIVGYASKALSLGYCANYGEITYSGNDDNLENGFILGGCSSSNKTLATEILSVGKSSSIGTALTNPTYYAVSKNASVTYSYYDSDKLTDIQGLSSNGGGDALSTSELINGTTLDNFYYGDWNYQTGRYPIPNLKDNISAVAWNLLVSTVSEQ